MERSAVGATPSTATAPVGVAAGDGHSHSHAHHHFPDDALDKYDDIASDLSHSASRKRDLDDYEDDDDDDEGDDGADYSHSTGNTSSSKDSRESKHMRSASGTSASANAKRMRRHNWQKKYAVEYGLVVIEKDATTGGVTLAMCGFCKAFGRENKIEHVLQSDDGDGESKKRRRRSLTTIKFFRTFRVDNIRSHLQGAHPRRWAAFEALPKHDAVRARYLQVQGDTVYEGLHIVDDVVLNTATLQTESDMAYAQAQVHALTSHAAPPALESTLTATIAHHTTAISPSAVATDVSQGAAVASSSTTGGVGSHHPASTHSSVQTHLGVRGTFDYEKHLTEQLALEREKLAFAKAKFAKDVELRERELALREKQMEHDREMHEKLRDATLDAAQQEQSKFFRLAEVLRDAVASAAHASAGSATVAQSSSLV